MQIDNNYVALLLMYLKNRDIDLIEPKYSLSYYNDRLVNLTNTKKKIVNIIVNNYLKELTELIDSLPNKYRNGSDLINGISFINFAKNNVNNQLYEYIVDLFSIEKCIDECNELITRSIKYEPLVYPE